MDDVKSSVQREFGARAEAYVTSPGHAQGNDLDRLVELAGITGDTIALDVATGGGHTALAVSRKAKWVVASDLTPSMLTSAAHFIAREERSNVECVAADAEALPFADGSFSLVTCRIAPHHFPDVGLFVQECARVLAPGGKVVLEDSVVPEDPSLDHFMNTLEKTRDYTHGRSYTEPQWRAFFEAAGLTVQHTETWAKAHPFRDWMERGAMLDKQKDWVAVEQMLRSASEQTKEEFKVNIEQDGEIASFEDRKLILVAVK